MTHSCVNWRQSLSLVIIYLERNLHPLPLEIPGPEIISAWQMIYYQMIYLF